MEIILFCSYLVMLLIVLASGIALGRSLKSGKYVELYIGAVEREFYWRGQYYALYDKQKQKQEETDWWKDGKLPPWEDSNYKVD